MGHPRKEWILVSNLLNSLNGRCKEYKQRLKKGSKLVPRRLRTCSNQHLPYSSSGRVMGSITTVSDKVIQIREDVPLPDRHVRAANGRPSICVIRPGGGTLSQEVDHKGCASAVYLAPFVLPSSPGPQPTELRKSHLGQEPGQPHLGRHGERSWGGLLLSEDSPCQYPSLPRRFGYGRLQYESVSEIAISCGPAQALGVWTRRSETFYCQASGLVARRNCLDFG